MADIRFPTDTVGKVPAGADLIPLADSAASNAFKETTVTDLSTAIFGLKTTTNLTEGTNLYFTDARVEANADVAANTSDRHSHSNKAILDATTASFTTADQSVVDGIIAASQKVYVDGTNGSDSTGDGSIALPYATIQHAIDVITDATATKQYLIDIVPGEYVENITTKPYIHLNGVGVVVSGSTGPLLTLGAGVSYVFRITFNLTPTTIGQTIISSTNASGDSELNFCTFNVTSSTNDITSRIIDISAGSITLTESIYNYTMLGTSVNVKTHEIFKSSGTASINIFRNTVVSVVEDENDIVKCFSDSGAGNFFSSSVVVQMVTSNASFTGTMIGFSFTGGGNVKILGLNNVFIIGAGSGTGLATEMDTSASQLAENFSSRFLVAGFTNNYYANIASGDILNSYFNTVTAADGSIISGTINKLDGDNNGNFTVNTDIIDENTFLSGSTNDSLNDLFNIGFNAGWVSGGAITDNLDGTIDVAAGTGVTRTSNDEQAPVKMFDWAASTSIALSLGDNYIYIDYNAGTPNIQVTTTGSDITDNENDKFELYEVYKEDATTIHIGDHKQRAKNVPGRLQQYLYSKNIIERGNAEGGLILGETGTRNVTMSQGKIWIKLNPTILGPIDTSGLDTFDRYYGCATTCTKTTGNTQWDNAQWDNAGTLTAFVSSRFGFQDFYVDADNEILSVYSTAQYTSQALAENASIPTPPGRTEDHSLYIGRIVFQEGGATALSILSPFTGQELSPTPVTDHGALSGLGDDDHTQYSLLAGRSGGQTLNGSTDSGENLTLSSTSNATKGGILVDSTYLELDEITTPANPAADKGRMYVKDDTGTTTLYFRDSAGAETDLLAGGSGTDADAIHDNVAAEISVITEKVTPVSGDFLLIEDSADTNNKKRIQVGNLPTAGGGEANTASNGGTGGIGIVLTKVGIDLPFKSIAAASTKISVADDAVNDNVDIDVNEANLTLSNLGGAVTDAQVPNTITLDNITQITNRSHTGLTDIGTNTHSQIDSHISATANPHTVTATQVGLGNVDDTSDATKNAATATLTNKTLDDATTSFADNVDNTKKAQFELSGISTTTTRTLTVPDVSGTLLLNEGDVTVNEAGADVDFRVESNVNDHTLFVRGSDGHVGFNNSNPKAGFTIGDAAAMFTLGTGAAQSFWAARNIYTDDGGVTFKRLVADNDCSALGFADDGGFDFYSNSDANTAIDSAVTLKHNVRIAKSGSVGIGTSSPSANADLTLGNGALCLAETTTPTADTNFGKVYTKTDNELYFQDGAGVESKVSNQSGGGGGSMITFQRTNNVGSSTNYYNDYTNSTTIDILSIAVQAGTLQNLTVNTSINTMTGGSGSIFAIMKNGVATAITLTVPNTTTGVVSDISNTVSVALGDRIELRRVSNHTGGSITTYGPSIQLV